MLATSRRLLPLLLYWLDRSTERDGDLTWADRHLIYILRDERSRANGCICVKVLPDRVDDGALESCSGDACDRTKTLRCPLNERSGDVVAILSAAFTGMARCHAIAAVIE